MKNAHVLLSVSSLLALVQPSTATAQVPPSTPGMPAEHVDAVDDGASPNLPLLLAGGLGLGLNFGMAVSAGAVAELENKSGWLAAPLIGPWVVLAARNYEHGCHGFLEAVCKAEELSDNTLVTVGLVVNGVFQLGSVALLVVGLATPKRAEREFAVAPWCAHEGGGVSLSARF